MNFTPPRGLGLSIGSMMLLLLLGTSGLAIAQLASSAFSTLTALWVLIPLISLPLGVIIGYYLYGLASARYRLNRNGFYIVWGMTSVQIPLMEISSIQRARELDANQVLSKGMTWPGCLTGRRMIEGFGRVDFFATRGAEGLLLVNAGDRHLAISPPDPDAFLKTFGEMMRQGSLERIASRSYSPDFLFTRLWVDRPARWLILGGLVLPLGLLCYLALLAPSLPAEIPFGFDPSGVPTPLAPPGRLLLLPLVGGICWFADFVLGAWLYRSGRDRILAYGLWGSALLVGGLFWGAALHLLASA
jgi:hypothetical protein